ncbi:MAG: hypothetical protein LBQ79_08120, partial [Deltaproteobacteria bacterium]|nr:hypothetical protein [Deltaproteobacteria bacterium]
MGIFGAGETVPDLEPDGEELMETGELAEAGIGAEPEPETEPETDGLGEMLGATVKVPDLDPDWEEFMEKCEVPEAGIGAEPETEPETDGLGEMFGATVKVPDLEPDGEEFMEKCEVPEAGIGAKTETEQETDGRMGKSAAPETDADGAEEELADAGGSDAALAPCPGVSPLREGSGTDGTEAGYRSVADLPSAADDPCPAAGQEVTEPVDGGGFSGVPADLWDAVSPAAAGDAGEDPLRRWSPGFCVPPVNLPGPGGSGPAPGDDGGACLLLAESLAGETLFGHVVSMEG